MRALWFVVLVGCAAQDDGGPADPVDSIDGDTEVVACATWDDYACNGVLAACHAECLAALKIDCHNRECHFAGKGMGAGKDCIISVGDRQEGCGFCETAWKERNTCQ
jgi:hypothetical protein